MGTGWKASLYKEKAYKPHIITWASLISRNLMLCISHTQIYKVKGKWQTEHFSIFKSKCIISALLTRPKPLTVWITINCGKFFKRWEYQTTWPASWEICMQVRKQQLELDMEQQTGFKSGKKYVKAIYCHPAYLTYMHSTSWETLGWMKH